MHGPFVRAFALVFIPAVAFAAQSLQTPLNPASIPQFTQPLPTLGGGLTTIVGSQPLTLRMCEFKANILPPLTPLTAGATGQTTVWGYSRDVCPTGGAKGLLDSYLGPVIVNTRGSPSQMTFINDLGDTATSNLTFWKFSVDQTLHWADPLNLEANECNMSPTYPAFGSQCAQNYSGPIPAVAHLHGGEVPPEIDGGPDAWFTSDGLFHGHGYYTKFGTTGGNQSTYAYPNSQENSPIWFHDHTVGATRLNVYAGLAGAYYIEDPAIYPIGTSTAAGVPGTCTPGTGCLPANLPGVGEIVPLVLQDRMFDTSGELFFPADSAANILWSLNPEHPYWVPEFIGDTIVVNGKAWPNHNVQQKRYRFLFLNGSNARTYEIFLVNPVTKVMGPPIYVIGTDGGYLDAPVKIDPNLGQRLVIMPGERYEAIIDFANIPIGTRLLVRNIAKAPYPGGASPQGSTTGRLLQFTLIGPAVASDPSYNPALGTPLRSGDKAIQRLVNPTTGTVVVPVAQTRQLTLNEVALLGKTVNDPVTGALTAYPGGPVEILVNNTKWTGKSTRTYGDFTPVTIGGGKTAYYSELPQEGQTEVWEIVNTTADAHPMHLHLVQFQLINRQNYNASNYFKAYSAAFPAAPGCTAGIYCPGFGPPLDYRTGNPRALGGNVDVVKFLQGAAMPPLPQEAGWKDTVMVPPGQVTRIAVRWAPTSLPVNMPSAQLNFPFDPNGESQHGYVWHCHIVDHEDNEMMRPDLVKLNPDAPAPALRPLTKASATNPTGAY